MKALLKYKNFCIFVLFTSFISLIQAQDTPFATVKIAEDKYFDETEIDIGSWLSYYTWVLIHEGFDEAQKVLPDSTVIEKELWNYIKKKSSYYIERKGRFTLQPIGFFDKECQECENFGKRLRPYKIYCPMLDFPVSGLTYEQVTKFCEWRTKHEGDNKLVFRLPTNEEWREFALISMSEVERKNGLKDSVNNKNCALFNYQISCSCNNEGYQGKLNAIGLYSREKNGAFDVFGNVSEMTSIKGIAKGGSFKSFANQCHPDSIQIYTKPEIWLGFRCIAVKNSNSIINTGSQQVPNSESSSLFLENSRFDNFTDPRDNTTYPTVLIGKQTWIATNLSFKPDSGNYWVYYNDNKYAQQFGYLYTWETANCVCPSGWHLPTKNDYEILLQEYGGSGNLAFEELSIGGASGFGIIGSGFRFNMNFIPQNAGSAFWTSTEINKKKAWVLRTGGMESIATLTDFLSKKSGLSVRCIKDKE